MKGRRHNERVVYCRRVWVMPVATTHPRRHCGTFCAAKKRLLAGFYSSCLSVLGFSVILTSGKCRWESRARQYAERLRRVCYWREKRLKSDSRHPKILPSVTFPVLFQPSKELTGIFVSIIYNFSEFGGANFPRFVEKAVQTFSPSCDPCPTPTYVLRA